MMQNEGRLTEAFAAIDAANACDPHKVSVNGSAQPAELLYGQRMSEALEKLHPDASELLKLAVRAQHIRRWTVPRSAYPMDRPGYLRWRNELKRVHADLAAEIMERCRYSAPEIERVKSLVKKENLKRDPEAQALEDVACLVFLEHYAAAFAVKHDEEKMLGILKKTWAKMSEEGRAAALRLDLEPQVKLLVTKAVAS